MIVDIVEVKVEAGHGGDGHVSFRREKNVAKGGPNGGDGGDGGNVYVVANHNMSTLMDFRKKKFYKAGNGVEGGRDKKTGANGEDIVVKVPLGTLIYELHDGDEVLIGDLTVEGQEVLVAKGGYGGTGNYKFASSVNRTPRQYTPGTLGESKTLKLEVKMIADVGLVGLPNAGKSTLLNQMTPSSAKVGEYPFTTLSPNLGVCTLTNGNMVVIADIPGLIEGASMGKGLGDEFLRHVERTRIIVHVIDPLSGSCEDLVENSLIGYRVIRRELENYSKVLLEKSEIVTINKLDVTEVKESFGDIKKGFEREGVKVFGISAVTGEGVDELKRELMEVLDKTSGGRSFEVKKPLKVYNIENLPNKRIIFRQRYEK